MSYILLKLFWNTYFLIMGFGLGCNISHLIFKKIGAGTFVRNLFLLVGWPFCLFSSEGRDELVYIVLPENRDSDNTD